VPLTGREQNHVSGSAAVSKKIIATKTQKHCFLYFFYPSAACPAATCGMAISKLRSSVVLITQTETPTFAGNYK
jgi:hypothetical protein